MSEIRLARAGAIRCANRAGAAMRPRAGETRAKQGPGAGTGGMTAAGGGWYKAGPHGGGREGRPW